MPFRDEAKQVERADQNILTNQERFCHDGFDGLSRRRLAGGQSAYGVAPDLRLHDVRESQEGYDVRGSLDSHRPPSVAICLYLSRSAWPGAALPGPDRTLYCALVVVRFDIISGRAVVCTCLWQVSSIGIFTLFFTDSRFTSVCTVLPKTLESVIILRILRVSPLGEKLPPLGL